MKLQKTVKTPKLKIKSGDKVRIIDGKDKGQEGSVTRVLPKQQRVIVEGLNMVSRHTKPNADRPQGEIVRKEAPLHISNVQLIDPSTKTTSRVGRKLVDGKLQRYFKKSGEIVK